MAYAAKIIADSINEADDRLTTFEVTFPRIVLAEFNTHRMFSRNSASSRAIPVEKQIQKVLDDPFIPIYWGKNQKGMQASVELSERERKSALKDWLSARDAAVYSVQILVEEYDLHKQIVNRLLEPFMWQTVICTGTEYSNFFALRANPQAQPEIRKIAEMMKELYESETPIELEYDEWHLPYINEEDIKTFDYDSDSLCKVSAARCARVSYLTQDGKRDIQADLDLYERLTSSGHLSPLEHVAIPQNVFTGAHEMVDHSLHTTFRGNFKGWTQLRKSIENENDFSRVNKK